MVPVYDGAGQNHRLLVPWAVRSSLQKVRSGEGSFGWASLPRHCRHHWMISPLCDSIGSLYLLSPCIRTGYMLPLGILIPTLLLVVYSFPGIGAMNIVTLGSIEIFDVHEWFLPDPIIYFHCHGEKNKTILPDVKKSHVLYIFNGEESWQPLTKLPEKKCKRCGFYEKDTFKSDDVFDEWELCPADFVDGKYIRYKENEFNATFVCPDCIPSTGSEQQDHQNAGLNRNRRNVALIVVLCVLASLVVITGMTAAYKYWQKRRREEEKARFLKLFNEGEDFGDELDLDPIV
ncbi:hypothetical protein HPP92_006587 [Vanilla planifolia]|uniref:DUF7953 domain-containing protein n=1 Tax=Vanilla planifolia TaxID=51239 RepID=A0A835R8L1_VANPL|nr:hypothetical protein HPP92_006587 [Vanilla planifolia]